MRAILKPPECRAWLRWVALGWARLGWAGLRWAGLRWAGLRWVEQGCVGLGQDELACFALLVCAG